MTTYASPAAKTRAATLIGLTAIGLWSVLALMTAASGKAPPFEMAALTFLVGGGFGLAYAAARGRLGALRQPWPVWAVGVGGLFGYHALYFAALRLAPPAEASLIAYLWPLLIVLMSALLPGERLSGRHLVGALIGFLGAGVLFWGKAGGAVSGALTRDVALGYALALGCAFVWSSYSVLSRFLKSAPTEAVAGFCLATSLLAAICHFAFETTIVPESATPMGGHRRPRPRARRPRLLCLGPRRQAGRHPPARRRRLCRACPLDADPGPRRLRAGNRFARARLRADRGRGGGGVAVGLAGAAFPSSLRLHLAATSGAALTPPRRPSPVRARASRQ